MFKICRSDAEMNEQKKRDPVEGKDIPGAASRVKKGRKGKIIKGKQLVLLIFRLQAVDETSCIYSQPNTVQNLIPTGGKALKALNVASFEAYDPLVFSMLASHQEEMVIQMHLQVGSL